MNNLILVIIIAIVAAVIDYLWLGIIAKSFYSNQLGSLMRPAGAQFDPRLFAAIAVYLLIALAIVFFVLPQGASSFGTTLLWGAFMGFVIYGIYETTNIAILQNWTWKLVFIDTLWGALFLAGLSAIAHYFQNLFT